MNTKTGHEYFGFEEVGSKFNFDTAKNEMRFKQEGSIFKFTKENYILNCVIQTAFVFRKENWMPVFVCVFTEPTITISPNELMTLSIKTIRNNQPSLTVHLSYAYASKLNSWI